MEPKSRVRASDGGGELGKETDDSSGNCSRLAVCFVLVLCRVCRMYVGCIDVCM